MCQYSFCRVTPAVHHHHLVIMIGIVILTENVIGTRTDTGTAVVTMTATETGTIIGKTITEVTTATIMAAGIMTDMVETGKYTQTYHW